MRHIPDEELHAYLDQALSRSQCVEIESHLAGCSSCRGSRDAIASLRDRTTALLAVLAPPLRLPPPFEELDRAARPRRASRRGADWARRGAMAASLAIAMGLGWMSHFWLVDRRGAGYGPAPAVALAPAKDSEPARAMPLPRARPRQPAAPPQPGGLLVLPARTAYESAAPGPFSLASDRPVESPSPDIDAAAPAPLEPVRDLDGIWRTVSLDRAEAESGSPVPRIDGLPVVQIRLRQGDGDRPMVAVDQQLASGEMVRTLEGPAAQLSGIIARPTATISTLGAPAPPPSEESSLAFRHGNRIVLLMGRVSPDSLKAFMLRMRAR